MSSTWATVTPMSPNGVNFSRPLRAISISVASAEWSPGPYTPPGIDDYGVAGGDEPLGHQVGPVLRLVVAGQEAPGLVAPEGLVDDLTSRVPERPDGGHVHRLRHAGVVGGLQHPAGPLDVRLPHLLALRPGHAHAVVAGDVEARIGAVQSLGQGGVVAQPALDQLAADPAEVRGLLGGPDQRHHLVAALPEALGHPPSDESRRPGQEGPHLCPSFSRTASATCDVPTAGGSSRDGF